MQTRQTDLNEPPCELVEEEGVPQSSASSPIGMIGEEEVWVSIEENWFEIYLQAFDTI